MRLWPVVVVAIVFGCTAGMGMTWFELGRVVENFESVSQTKVSTTVSKALTSSDVKSPRAVVEGGPKYEFGTIAYGATSERIFVVHNEGDQDLVIEFDYPSCGKCIETKFTKAVVAPGSQCSVPVTYHARKDGPGFEESAHMKTNDPRMPSMVLAVAGTITKPVRLMPSEITFGTVSSSDGATGRTILLGYHSDTISIPTHKFLDDTMTDRFEIEVTPMSLEKVIEKDKHARCGVQVQVKAKSGLPLGPFNANLALTVRAEKDHTIELPVTGEVVGDVTLIGKNYNAEKGVVSLGLMKHGVGGSTTLFLLVKGAYRNDVKFTVHEVTPANALQVKLGEATSLADGKAIKIPLTIEVPKSAPAQTHMGDARGEFGKITLETTHPTVKQVPISVRFVIE